MKKHIAKIRRRKQPPVTDAQTPARITNETVAVHREEILKGARKYIYPLQQSKHRLVMVSVTLFIVAVISFFAYCIIALYKTKNTSDFMYKVTKVVPFPIARIGSDFIAYENYLFEIKRYTHYYETQQSLDFKTEAGQQQLADYKKRALQEVIDDTYIKEIAEEKGISVSNREIDDEIATVRAQNRLGASDKEFEAVLKDFWGWSVNDFKRSLKKQLLRQKVASALDTEAHAKANQALADLKAGKDFAAVAKQYSEDPSTKDNGGEYTFLVDKTNRDLSPKTVDALFKLKPGEYSEIVDVGYGLEIVKVIEIKENQLRASHIAVNFKDISQTLNDRKAQKKTRTYVQF
jgi:parvulin-like peptidyl-prolyl isomerase